MSNCKRRVWPDALVILCLLAGLAASAALPAGSNKAIAQSSAAPDLVVESISWSPEVPVIRDKVTFTAIIRNQGGSQAGPSYVTYYIDDILISSVPVDQTNADAATTNTFTWKAQAGEHTITAVIDGNGKIAESNEDNNEKTYAFSVLAADLISDSIAWSPENPSAGERVTFTATFKNQGNYRAAGFYVNFYIDGNSRGQRLVLPLDPETSANVTYTWTALSGSHTVRATADVSNHINESDEANNDKTVTYTTATPDLVIDPITWSPVSRSASDNVTFTVTVRNQGSGTAESSWLVYFVDDVCQGSAFINRLNPGATTTKTFSQIIGADAHTFKAMADATGSVAETDETNNTGTATLPALAPDLIIQGISWSPAQPLIAHKVTFIVTIKNQGARQSSGADLNIYIDFSYKFQQRLSAIPVGSTVTASVPWVTQGSSTTVRAVVDEDNYIKESNESNNEMTKTVTFVAPSPTTDLKIESITCTPAIPSIGDTVTITAAIKNKGPGQASPSHVAYYIDDIRLDSVYVNQIDAGDTVTNTATWSATGGTHTIRAVIDCNGSVLESDESNNEMSVVILIPAPDLVIQGITWSPKIPSTGDEVTLTLTIKNRGDLKAGGSYVSYYINGAYQGNHYIEDIDPGATVTRDFPWTFPAGEHTFKAIVDEANSVIEGDESNNEKTAVIPAPDLTIEAITWSPVEPSENSSVTFMITAGNIGNSTAYSPYLDCYIDDTLLTNLPINSIAAGTSAAGIFTWTAQPGEHVFRVIADGNDSITESNESNNEKVIDLTHPVAPAEAIPVPEPVDEAAPTATEESNELEESAPTIVETSEAPPIEALLTDNTTDEQDIAANIADTSPAGWRGILMNKLVIIGVGAVGVGAIVVLLLLRKRSKKS